MQNSVPAFGNQGSSRRVNRAAECARAEVSTNRNDKALPKEDKSFRSATWAGGADLGQRDQFRRELEPFRWIERQAIVPRNCCENKNLAQRESTFQKQTMQMMHHLPPAMKSSTHVAFPHIDMIFQRRCRRNDIRRDRSVRASGPDRD